MFSVVEGASGHNDREAELYRGRSSPWEGFVSHVELDWYDWFTV